MQRGNDEGGGRFVWSAGADAGEDPDLCLLLQVLRVQGQVHRCVEGWGLDGEGGCVDAKGLCVDAEGGCVDAEGGCVTSLNCTVFCIFFKFKFCSLEKNNNYKPPKGHTTNHSLRLLFEVCRRLSHNVRRLEAREVE